MGRIGLSVRGMVCAQARMGLAALAWTGLAALAWAGMAAEAWASDDAPISLQPGRLYLAAGTIETASQPNLLDEATAGFSEPFGYVIQLEGPMTERRDARLLAAGVVLHDYLPVHAYLADLSRTDVKRLRALGFVTWVGHWQDAWKVDPTIGARVEPFTTQERIDLENRGFVKLAVTLFHGADLAQGMNDLAALGADVLDGNIVARQGLVDLIFPHSQLALLAAEPYVQYIEEAGELTYRNSTNRWIVQSNISNNFPLYNNGIHGEGQLIGILDGKVGSTHCSFTDGQPFGDSHRKIQAYNTSTGYDQHGTHVAGTSVGDAFAEDNTRGIAYLGKLCYGTIPSFSESAMKTKLLTHHNQGARMHTNSWGDDGTTQYNSLCRGIDDFSYTSEDSLVFFAVTNQSTLRNPENAKDLLAVGASQDTPSQGNHCSGGRGPTNDGRRKPEIYAPGCNTISSSGTGCGTAGLSGTSMASPAVAATGMLVRQYYTDGYYPTGRSEPGDEFLPSGALVKATLLNSSVDMTGISGYPSATEGWGRVLADKALYFAGDARTLVAQEKRNAQGLSTGQADVYTIDVFGGAEQVRVTLVWTEPAAASGANPAYTNDVDLEVERPDGQTYLGNYFVSGESATGGTKDEKNNVEQVHVSNPAVGTWVVRVLATAVNVGPQGYALVVTGQVAEGGTIGDPTCDDIRKLTARCKDTGVIKGKVRLNSANFTGRTVSVLIDGSEAITATIEGDTALYEGCCYTTGDHTVALTSPPDCNIQRTTTCP